MVVVDDDFVDPVERYDEELEPHMPIVVPDISQPLDFRGIPTNACPNCGGRLFNIKAAFDNYDIALWLTDASCVSCGTLLTAPCPPDRPDFIPEDDNPYE
jgi:hypothetical protein